MALQQLRNAAQSRARLEASVLTLIAVALAVMCLWLAWAWSRENARAECWRAVAEGEAPPEGECP
jgi:hypothetical protein